MDPHIYPEQPGLSKGPDKDDEGANYLRHLKGSAGERAAGDPPGLEGKLAAAMATLGFKERRQSPRLRCSGSVEFRVAGSEARMWGTVTDISLHGCYVEMSNTFPVDTKVELVVKSCGLRIQTAGTVRASYPGLGMGICFAGIEPEQQLQLKQLLAMLTGHTAISAPESAREGHEREALETADPKAFLDAIQEFFRKTPLLSRDEFYKIAKRVR